MDRDVTAGVALSFLIVGLVAAAFHRPDRSPPAPSLTGHRGEFTTAPGPAAPPAPMPGAPLAEAKEPRPAFQTFRPARIAPPRSATEPSTRAIRTASRQEIPQGPASPFASVGEGETLADVARRVYGAEDALGRLREANRDQLEGTDGAIRAGMLLRTP